MNQNRIDRLPAYAWLKGLAPLKRDQPFDDALDVYGFDTEFDARSGELLTVQLWSPTREVFHANLGAPVSVDDLIQLADVRPGRRALLIAFFARVDIPKLTDFMKYDLSENTVGMLRLDAPRLSIMDIGVFWASDRTFTLAKLGAQIGCPKLDWERAKVSARDVSRPGFREYAMRDAEICFRAYDRLRASLRDLFQADLTRFKSAASVSAYCFRRRMTDPVNATGKKTRRLALRALWGGRSQVFRTGSLRGPIYEYDADSMYPRSAVSFGGFPDGSAWEYDADYRKGVGFAHVRFRYPASASRGDLPVIVEDRMTFPLEGESYCTFDELRLAARFGARLDILEARGSTDRTHRELPDYLSELLLSKATAQGTDRFVYKLLANSIIGKLAQNSRITDYGRHLRYTWSLGIPAFCLRPRVRSRTSIGSCYWPEVNALVLGRSRAVLGHVMRRVEAAGSHVFLCSTDSIVTDAPELPAATVYNHKIPWKREREGDLLEIWRAKVYRISKDGETVKLAHHAIPGHLARTMSLSDSMRFVEYKEFPGLARAVHGLELGKPVRRSKVVHLKGKAVPHA